MYENEIFESNIERLLSDKGLGEGCKEQAVRKFFYYQFLAMEVYRYMTDGEKQLAGEKYRPFRTSFPFRNYFKERKRKRKKEKSPLYPYKEKEIIKEKGDKSIEIENAERDFSKSLSERREDFRQECLSYVTKYGEQQVADFFHYWAEEDSKTGMMLFEMEKSWNTEFRLARWDNNQFTNLNSAAATRCRRTRKRQQQEQTVVDQQQAIALEREQANAKREEELAQSKANSITYEDYLKTHPEAGTLRRLTS